MSVCVKEQELDIIKEKRYTDIKDNVKEIAQILAAQGISMSEFEHRQKRLYIAF